MVHNVSISSLISGQNLLHYLQIFLISMFFFLFLLAAQTTLVFSKIKFHTSLQFKIWTYLLKFQVFTKYLPDHSNRCDCVNHYTGQYCETAPPPCKLEPCQNGATCTDVDETNYRCNCPAGLSSFPIFFISSTLLLFFSFSVFSISICSSFELRCMQSVVC